jgi:ferrous iron transport protein B
VSTPQAIRDEVMTRIYTEAAAIADDVVIRKGRPIIDWDQKFDDIVTSRIWGFPIMLGLLGVVFWLTIAGANVPSELIANLLFKVQDYLTLAFEWAHAPAWLHGLLVLGVYRGSAWVISVMLPPMAIFFPIFTLLEDFGYLPRVAFNLDRVFRAAGAHGKQSLTMGMGFGCNAAAIVSTRIIESPRERLIAILTNNFVPCNGRFPTLITMASIFMGGGVAAAYSSLVSSATVVGIVLVGIATTLAVSWTLSKTVLRGVPSRFTLELPPYRKPQALPVIVRSIYDRTLVVLYRAVTTAAPAGAITWILANIRVGDASVLAHAAHFLNPFGHALGLDGMILMAFLLGLPANEIVLPILIMGYMAAGAMTDVSGLDALKHLLVDQNGWTWLTALNLMLFSLLHYPCGTTLLTIYKETKSLKWSLFSALMPLAIAIGVTFVVAQVARGLGLVAG